jgi:glycosyltransferase involved in cell wall biosynthesis
MKVAFDMRDPMRSGIARVARSMARAFIENSATPTSHVLCGPTLQLDRLGAHRWGASPATIVDWTAGRFSLAAERQWARVSREAGDSIWYFPHWDMPWSAKPRRSIVLISDVIPLVVPDATSALRRVIARQWILRSARVASRLVVSTEFTKSEVLEIWPELDGRVSVVPLGVDAQFLGHPSPLPDALEDIASRAPFMLSVGNRKPHKNLIRGPEVLARVKGLRWIVAGEAFPGWASVVEHAQRLGVTDRMHVIDPPSDAVLHALYARSVCLFFPSRNEGFGLPILEALAAGTHVVIGAAGSSIEVLNGYGTVCGLDDDDAFAEGVQRAVWSGPPGPAAREYARGCSWKRSAAALERLMRDL